MTLSSGTLNLKFMQRAAARQQNSPATPRTSTPSSSRPTTSTPVNGDQKPAKESGQLEILNTEAGPSTPAPLVIPVAQEVEWTPAEKEARWSIPRRRLQDDTQSSHNRQRREFESGYMSFLLPVEGGEGSGGGGRMAFGGFGKKDEEEVVGDQEGDGDAQEDDVDMQDDRKENVKPRKRPRPTDSFPSPVSAPASSSRTFVKPEGFEDRPPRPTTLSERRQPKSSHPSETTPSAPSPSTHSSPSLSDRKKKRKGGPGKKPQVSQADRLRATISNARKANGSGSSTPTPHTIDEGLKAGSFGTPTDLPIDLTGSSSPPSGAPGAPVAPAAPATVDDAAAGTQRKKKRKNKDRESLLGTATPTSLASGTFSPIKTSASTSRNASPAAAAASTLDEKQAQMKAEKRRRRKERKKLKAETGLTIEGDEMG